LEVVIVHELVQGLRYHPHTVVRQAGSTL